MSRRDFRRFSKPPEMVIYVLDVSPYGDPIRHITHPLIQGIGEEKLLLLELRPKENVLSQFLVGEKTDLTAGVESGLVQFLRVIRYEDLTGNAKSILRDIVTNIVVTREKKFVEFFNKAQPLSKKAHELELLKGIGKKTLWKILEERSKKPFESFEEIEKRTGIKPVELIVNRILEELSEPQIHYLFVNPPFGPSPRFSPGYDRGRERFRQSF
ncbi:MAG: DUF655 domain-containing protein [Infirmifilum sp.]